MRLRLRSFLLVLFLVQIAVGGAIVLRNGLNRPRFRAHARMIVRRQPPKVLLEKGERDTSGDEYRAFRETQLALAKSQMVLNDALLDQTISRYHLISSQRDSVEWLQEHIIVEFVGDSDVMEISLRGHDPVEIAGIVNAVKAAYLDAAVDAVNRRRRDRYTQLIKIRDSYSEILQERRIRHQKTHLRVGVDASDIHEQNLAARYENLRSERLHLRKDRAEAETLLAAEELGGCNHRKVQEGDRPT